MVYSWIRRTNEAANLQPFLDNNHAAVDSCSCIHESALKSVPKELENATFSLWVRRPCPRKDLFYGQHAFMTTERNLHACQTSKMDRRQPSSLTAQQDAHICTHLPHSSTQAPTRCLKRHLSCPAQQRAGQQPLRLFSASLNKTPKPECPSTARTDQGSPSTARAQPAAMGLLLKPISTQEELVMTPAAPFETDVIS